VPTRQALARHPLAIAGALITTVAAIAFVVLALGMVAGLFNNPYAGLVIFVAIPAVFVAGLLLIPAGMWLQRRRLRVDASAGEWPVVDLRRADVRRTALVLAALTVANVIILLLAGYGGLHWMESPSFCGQVCHTPMEPQYVAWQGGSHARIACATCHIGAGAAGAVHAKLAGVRQLAHVVAGSYPRPIPSGVELEDQAQTCVRCHQPGHLDADRIRVIRSYADDEMNSETATVLRMHVSKTSPDARSSHWHADPAVRLEYVADASRQTILYVKATDRNGQVREFRAADATDEAVSEGPRRTMSCVDCHNTVGHPIAPTVEQAVDRAIATGRVSRALPFIRREGVRLLNESPADRQAAVDAIARGLQRFYGSSGHPVDGGELSRSITALQDVYRGNVFPAMKVTWGTYPSHKGHITSRGCFRCHDGSLAAKDGTTVGADCEYCHTQLETP
jgi:hypothetical protein